MTKSYYEVLGVDEDASEQEIKKAYRKMSLQYHPDRNTDPEAETMFKEINEAHETLSDESKRQQYDMERKFGGGPGPGGMPFPGGGGAEFHDINNIFRQFFGGGGMPQGGGMHFNMGPGQEFHFFHNGMGGGFPGFPGFAAMHRPPPIIKTLNLTMEQVYFGGNFPIMVEKWKIINNVKTTEMETINITVPPGIDENEVIILREMGNNVDNSNRGDIKICIQITNDTMFQRQGIDLVCERTISLKEALCGFKFEFRHLNNKTLSFNNLTNITVIKPGYKRIIPNLGINKNGQTGNLIINFNIVFPDVLTTEQIEGIRKWL